MAGGLLFFAFWDTAVNIAIGKLRIQFGETPDFCQKVWFCQIVWGFAKRYKGFAKLSENAVGIWRNVILMVVYNVVGNGVVD